MTCQYLTDGVKNINVALSYGQLNLHSFLLREHIYCTLKVH